MALTVITGPPASGKTTWVQAHAQPGDIVIDFDAIAQALTIDGDTHDHPRHVKHVAWAARQAAITEAITLARRCNVWIIDSLPRSGTLAHYHRAGARVITIDPGRPTVMARCRAQRTPAAVAAAQRWYDEAERTLATGTAKAGRW